MLLQSYTLSYLFLQIAFPSLCKASSALATTFCCSGFLHHTPLGGSLSPPQPLKLPEYCLVLAVSTQTSTALSCVVLMSLYFVLKLYSGCWLACRCCMHSLSPSSFNPEFLYCIYIVSPPPLNTHDTWAHPFHDGIFHINLFKHFILITSFTPACFHFAKLIRLRFVLTVSSRGVGSLLSTFVPITIAL